MEEEVVEPAAQRRDTFCDLCTRASGAMHSAAIIEKGRSAEKKKRKSQKKRKCKCFFAEFFFCQRGVGNAL